MDGNDIHMTWWRHQMESFPRYWPFVRINHPSPVDSSHKNQWHGVLMFSLICAWTNGWANNRDASDFRRHGAHYDVTVMKLYYVMISHAQRLLAIHVPPFIRDQGCGIITYPCWNFRLKMLYAGLKHYSDVKCTSWCLQSPVTLLFVQQLIRLPTRNKSKLHIAGSLWEETNGDRWIPLTKRQ